MSMMEQVTKQTYLLGQILDTLVDLKEDIKIVTASSAETSENMFNFVTNNSDALTEELRTFCNLQLMIIQHIENSNEEACSKRFPNWLHLLKDRRNEYWKQFKNEKMAEKYKKWRESTPTVIPRKFKPKVIKGKAKPLEKYRLKWQ